VFFAPFQEFLSRFGSDANLVSWACICPRSDESAGKRRSTRIRKGSPWLKTTLVQCAWAAVRKKDTYLHAQFHRIRARPAPKKAIVAVVRHRAGGDATGNGDDQLSGSVRPFLFGDGR